MEVACSCFVGLPTYLIEVHGICSSSSNTEVRVERQLLHRIRLRVFVQLLDGGCSPVEVLAL
jgi:hypothetical protein